jgi:4-hydroxy-3-methylbut-2-en-1-yl diphosphate reductase
LQYKVNMSTSDKIDFATWNEPSSDTPHFKVLRATHLGMCFGVRDAIELALNQTEPTTIFGDLVHNEAVLEQLREHGVQTERQPGSILTQNVMITAHGASQTAMGLLRERGLNVLEATCPLVLMAHRAVANLVKAGYHPVIIGKRDHVEVRGITEDLREYDVVLSDEDVANLAPRDRFGVAAQTTQPIERARHLVALIQQKFPNAELRFIDTVCQPTKQRQRAAVEIARQSDVVVVIGGARSNNTRELVETCGQHCARVHHVQDARDLREEWFFDARTVGITAGTSTPDSAIDEVENWVQRMASTPVAA